MLRHWIESSKARPRPSHRSCRRRSRLAYHEGDIFAELFQSVKKKLQSPRPKIPLHQNLIQATQYQVQVLVVNETSVPFTTSQPTSCSTHHRFKGSWAKLCHLCIPSLLDRSTLLRGRWLKLYLCCKLIQNVYSNLKLFKSNTRSLGRLVDYAKTALSHNIIDPCDGTSKSLWLSP